MKSSFIWLIVAGFIVGLCVLAVNLYDDVMQAAQTIEEKAK